MTPVSDTEARSLVPSAAISISPRAPSATVRGTTPTVGATSFLLPTSGVPPMSPGEGRLLTKALLEGERIFWSLAVLSGQEWPGLSRSREFLFRRWVLETLLVLRLQGPSSYNALSRALGWPAGESLAPKLDALCSAGLASRSVTARSPLRVQYALTPLGEQLGSGVYTLTRWKALHALAVRNPSAELPALENLGRRVSVSPDGGRAALERYLQATTAFAKTREAFCRPVEFENGLVTARRFCRAWVHKWHSRVLLALAIDGPMGFVELRRSLGVGDQALAVAIAGLLELNSIEPAIRPGGRHYAVAPFGWSDLALGAPLGLVFLDASRGRESGEIFSGDFQGEARAQPGVSIVTNSDR